MSKHPLPAPVNIHAPRMILVPATAELMGLEIADPQALGRTLHAHVPSNWPPELIRDALGWFRSRLEAMPELAGWLCWYGVARQADAEEAILVASGGFMGPPIAGTVEVGYSVLPQFQGQGYATEMVGGLMDWAWTQPGVAKVVAEVLPGNAASRRVLAKLGFVQKGTATEPGHVRFEYTR